MSSKKTAVYGIYSSVMHAEQTVDKLIVSGFPSGSISVLVPDSASTRDFAHKKETKAPEGATTGATAGGVIGGALGVLAGIRRIWRFRVLGTIHCGWSDHGRPCWAWCGWRSWWIGRRACRDGNSRI